MKALPLAWFWQTSGRTADRIAERVASEWLEPGRK
jgi:hypothetical protein